MCCDLRRNWHVLLILNQSINCKKKCRSIAFYMEFINCILSTIALWQSPTQPNPYPTHSLLAHADMHRGNKEANPRVKLHFSSTWHGRGKKARARYFYLGYVLCGGVLCQRQNAMYKFWLWVAFLYVQTIPPFYKQIGAKTKSSCTTYKRLYKVWSLAFQSVCNL